MIERTMVLRMSRAVDFANRADIPLAINANVAKMVAFETGFRIPWVVLVKWTVYRYSVYSPGGQDLMIQLSILDGQLDGGSERGGGGRRGSLWIGCRSQLG